MLPNLAALRLSEPPKDVSDVDVVLQDLPDAILSKVLRDTNRYDNGARSLCAAADALKQTSRGFRDMTAWSSIAAEHQMPFTPTHPRPDDTVQDWRAFVLAWCDDIRVGRPEGSDLSYVQMALNTEMNLGTREGYAWLLKHGGVLGVGGLEWMREEARQNVTSVKNVNILWLQLDKFTDGRRDKYKLLDELFKLAIYNRVDKSLEDTIQCMKWIYFMLVYRPHWEDTRENVRIRRTQGEDAMEDNITANLDRIKERAYNDVARVHSRVHGRVQHEEFMEAAITAMEMNSPWNFPSVGAIGNFLVSTLELRYFRTANWFFARHKELIRQNMRIVDGVAQVFADDMEENRDQRASVAAWRAMLQSAEPS